MLSLLGSLAKLPVPWNPSVPVLPSTGITHTITSFVVVIVFVLFSLWGPWRSNSGPPSFKANTLQIALSSQPLNASIHLLKFFICSVSPTFLHNSNWKSFSTSWNIWVICRSVSIGYFVFDHISDFGASHFLWSFVVSQIEYITHDALYMIALPATTFQKQTEMLITSSGSKSGYTLH